MNTVELIFQLLSLALITVAGPAIIALLFLKQGNL
uniref:Photosystem II reaction center protein Psb30 n=1 Tax=Trachelomonas volvocina TaxID=103340 RepID=A0A0G3VP62_9EUGL|nr:photosystem II reaction center protein [Trachelomonas volvocina]AKL82461.1 photosystem II reaction center protein [Trachelomonas volvocina]